MPEITLTHVTKRWGKFYAVNDLSMTIEDNAFVTLLGPSGCGKTTTLRMIAGLETPTSGRITIGDQVVFDSELGINVPANKRKVGFLFQNYALWPNMTVYQNIAFGLSNIKEPRRLSKEEIDRTVRRVAGVVKIDMLLDRYPAELSGGQQQRVAIARTLAPEPTVLFMDEPLSNLDAKLRLEMRYELQRLHVEIGSTFVYVTHDQMEAMTLATKICLIENGILQQYQAPLEIYHRPANLFVADFVGNPSINFVEAKETRQKDGKLEMTIFDNCRVLFTPTNPFPPGSEPRPKDAPGQDGENLVLGIRPEFIRIAEDSPLEGEIYGAMPTGMESTIKIRVGNFLLTSVVFGSTLFHIGESVHVGFSEEGMLLFDRRSGQLIEAGKIEIME